MPKTNATPVEQTVDLSPLGKLLENPSYLQIPKTGDVVKGKILSVNRREVRLDLAGMQTGVVRGRELFAESLEFKHLDIGHEVEATVIDIENENGEVELSFRFAGQKKAWEELRRLFTSNEPVEVKILEANKGGLLVRVEHINGFLPVSQLAPDHYPRVTGGDKQKILERLKSYVGDTFKARILDMNEEDEKLIVSEKAVWEESQKNIISKYKVGSLVEGDVTAIADFGAFVKFDGLEGLVHISEIAWQRIDHPRDLLHLGQHVKAEIIGLEGSKIFLSMKKLVSDPWQTISERYKVGDVVQGKVLKVNPFGFFVELDPEIHGLAHVSELSDAPIKNIDEIGKIGETLPFKIVSIEPQEHRLGLSIKAIKAKEETKEKEAKKE
ncbi:S1 RNA-binding domain-containing protein [Candidatus Uhrbacteria bacterium]|nr:S1 RNA-binding domain-containing protein [Candidatus Uhrbacteria bacterium]